MKLFAHFNPASNCDLYRILLPYRYCGPAYPEHDFDLSVTDPAHKYDIYQLHGLVSFKNIPYISKWKMQGSKFLWSLDDDFLNVPEWNHAKPTEDELASWYCARDMADLIVVSTQAIADTVNRPNKTVVAKNLFEVAPYTVTTPVTNTGKLRIVWAGSKTHTGDLAILDEPVDRILSNPQFKDQVEFIFVGSIPNATCKKYLNRGVHLENGVSSALYPALMCNIRPDIVLAPLVDCTFNRSKSCIRILEAWSLVAPVIASSVGEYKLIKDGIDGLTATTADEWTTALERLIIDKPLRLSLGLAGRQRAQGDWDWANDKCRNEWYSVMDRIIDTCCNN